MKLDLAELLHEPGRSAEYEIQEPPIVDEDLECVQPLTGRIVFTNAGGTLLLRGKVQTGVALPCSLCTEYFEQPVSFKIEEDFELSHQAAGPRALPAIMVLEEDENPDAGKLFDGTVFHLTELLRQCILLEEPTRPVPLEQEGRCVQCKRTRQEVLGEALQEAETEQPPVNPAFAVLQTLLQQQQEEKQ